MTRLAGWFTQTRTDLTDRYRYWWANRQATKALNHVWYPHNLTRYDIFGDTE